MAEAEQPLTGDSTRSWVEGCKDFYPSEEKCLDLVPARAVSMFLSTGELRPSPP